MVQKTSSTFMDPSLCAAATGAFLYAAVGAPPTPPQRLSGTGPLIRRHMPLPCIGITAQKLEQNFAESDHREAAAEPPPSSRRRVRFKGKGAIDCPPLFLLYSNS